MSFKKALFIKMSIKKPFPSTFGRFVGTIAETSEVMEKDNVINIPTLFVPIKFRSDMYQIVKPNVNLEYLTQNCAALQTSCDRRNIKINIEEVVRVCEKWLMVKGKHEKHVKTLADHKTFLQSCSAAEKKNESVTKLSEMYIENISNSKQEYYEMDDVAMPLFAKIPNILHADTPTESCIPEVICETKRFKFDVKSHVVLATAMNALEFSCVSPTAYYLIGKLAYLEQAIQSFFENQLENRNFVPISSVDFCKSFMIDACGRDPYSAEDAIAVKSYLKETRQQNNIVGTSSFETFCAYFVNMNMDKQMLPVKYFTTGRFYDAGCRNCKTPSLFSVVQSHCIHCCIVSKPSHKEQCFDELRLALTDIFSSLNLPFRIVYVSVKNLSLVESRRIDIELWSPHLRKYIVCANVSQCDDFVSNRLQMTYGTDFKIDGYLNVVHGFAIKIPIVLGCIMENLQCEDGTFLIPDVLKECIFES